MYRLFVLNETYTNGYRIQLLDFISIDSIFCGILVIISKNPIVSVLFLIGLFFSISLYLIAMGINFIGLSYLLIYVGAVSILFIFILMLIDVRISELLSDTSKSIPLAIFTVIAFTYPVYNVLPYSLPEVNRYNLTLSPEEMNILHNKKSSDFLLQIFNDNGIVPYITSNIWDGSLLEITHIISIGNIMYTNYSIWLLITSIILLLAMVGAIIITIKQKI